MSRSIVQKFKNVGPGALVAAGFIGPGTVTTCTVSGASYGYTMLWALLFATVATIIFQEMASRVGIVSGKGLGENIRDRIPNKALMWIAIVIVLIAITWATSRTRRATSRAASWASRLCFPTCR